MIVSRESIVAPMRSMSPAEVDSPWNVHDLFALQTHVSQQSVGLLDALVADREAQGPDVLENRPGLVPPVSSNERPSQQVTSLGAPDDKWHSAELEILTAARAEAQRTLPFTADGWRIRGACKSAHTLFNCGQSRGLRGAVFPDVKILLVQERSDGLWTLSGGQKACDGGGTFGLPSCFQGERLRRGLAAATTQLTALVLTVRVTSSWNVPATLSAVPLPLNVPVAPLK